MLTVERIDALLEGESEGPTNAEIEEAFRIARCFAGVSAGDFQSYRQVSNSEAPWSLEDVHAFRRVKKALEALAEMRRKEGE